MKEIFKNNQAWVSQQLEKDPDYFRKLARGQNPRYLFIGCSDSRVPANEITGTEAGEMFVHRNIANLVVHTDMNLLSVLQYAVEVLKVQDVIVCGHKECGGVAAAMTNQQFGLIDNWLRNIKDVIRLHAQELNSIPDEQARRDRLVELNVIEQVKNLCQTSVVQNAWKSGQPLQLHGLVYHVGEGILKELEIDLSDYQG
ncbi:carbonate dehydratase [Cesiribacter andamanensis]|uniref:Carbonic anhydrase n=1 Tax=Cesiribacter andamanensis AMV16 TaxID=1279009 RepID=M7MX87_9BACT|nr:carbonate dehydratase [Cesiribacter andamanensis]EMR01048.1 Carbonic anhydrase 2 [Cesiribacter andamanensis AMV16]